MAATRGDARVVSGAKHTRTVAALVLARILCVHPRGTRRQPNHRDGADAGVAEVMSGDAGRISLTYDGRGDLEVTKGGSNDAG